MVGARTGTPVDVLMVVTSVGEKSRLLLALAAPNLVSTRLGSASYRPRSILVDVGGGKGMVGRWESAPASVR